MIDKDLLFSKKCLFLTESRVLKRAACGVKLLILKYFENIGLSSPINIHMVLRRINYRRNTVEMPSFQKYEVFY